MTTELVTATTDEITAMTADEARDITDKIKAGAEAVWELITRAYTSRAWVALGYSSWDDYCTREFGTSRIRLPREERAGKVLSLRESGLSLRAIESATGISRPTIIKDLKTAEVVNSLPPEPPGAITGKTPGNTDRVKAILEKVHAAQAAEPVDAETVPVVEPMPPSVKTDVVQNRTVEPVPVSRPKIVGVDGKAYTAKKKPVNKPVEPEISMALWSPDMNITVTANVDYDDLRPWTISLYRHAVETIELGPYADPSKNFASWISDPDKPECCVWSAVYLWLDPLFVIANMANWIATDFATEPVDVARELLDGFALWDHRVRSAAAEYLGQ